MTGRYQDGIRPQTGGAQSPQRMTLSRVIELLTEQQSSRAYVKLVRPTRDGVQVEVSVSVGSEPGIDTIADARGAAQRTLDALEAAYPLAPPVEDADVKLVRNAKGDTQLEVKVTAVPGSDVATIAAVQERAGRLFQDLRQEFPLNSGAVGA